MKKRILFISLIGMLCSCSSPLDNKFNGNATEKNIQEIKSKLDSTELMLLVGSMLRLQMTGEKIENMTYREILENGKEWKAQQKIIEAEQEAFAKKEAEEARIKRLTESVIVTCFEKSYTEHDDHQHINYTFEIQNKSSKAILALKGGVLFTDLMGHELKGLYFAYNQPIEAGKKVTWNTQTVYNKTIAEDVSLINKALKDLNVVWNPEKIIFEDGTTLQ